MDREERQSPGPGDQDWGIRESSGGGKLNQVFKKKRQDQKRPLLGKGIRGKAVCKQCGVMGG